MISEDNLIKPKPIYDKSYSSFTHKGDHDRLCASLMIAFVRETRVTFIVNRFRFY